MKLPKSRFLTPGDTSADVFSSNQPAKINIHYVAYRPLGKLNASVFIIRSDGLTCCMMRTKLDNFDLIVEDGYGVISLLIDPLQLVSGTYFIETWFLNESDSMTLNSVAGRSDWFTVKGAALSYEETSGVFEPHTLWQHEVNVSPSVVNINQKPTHTQFSTNTHSETSSLRNEIC